MWHKICLLVLFTTAVVSAANLSRHKRVVNGTDVAAGVYPMMVSLHNGINGTINGIYRQQIYHDCGATIINDNWALTAAHCVDIKLRQLLRIIAGTIDIDNAGGSIHQVVSIRIHEDYDAYYLKNDIALVRVTPPFPSNSMYGRTTLPPQGQETANGTAVTLIGWGSNQTNGSSLHLLQGLDYSVISDEDCKKSYNDQVSATNICAYYPGGYKGQCYGDAGGPLFTADKVQIGIASWSRLPCAAPNYPGVFTKVSHYVDWINSKINAI